MTSGITEADLRRATSDLYYALFHRVCETLAGSVGVIEGADESREIYRALYRQPDHGALERGCRAVAQKPLEFSPGIRNFADQIIALKTKRQEADYDPLAQFARSSVINDIAIVEATLDQLDHVPRLEQVRFVYAVSFGGR